MKYVILKSSALLCFQFAEQNGNPLQIFCFDRKEDFNNYLEENEADVHGLPATDKIDAEFVNIGKILPKAGNVLPKVVEDGFFIRHKEKFIKVRFADIMWVEASRSYSSLHLKGQSPLLVSYPMADVKQKLPADAFMQIHRSYVVNLNYVEGFIGNILYIDTVKLPISKAHRQDVFSKFIFLDAAKVAPSEKEED